MKSIFRIGQRSIRIAIILMLVVFSLTVVPLRAQATSTTFNQVNLVSDIPGLALHTDPDLVNPWGLSHSGASPIWVSDNGMGVSTLYNGAGTKLALVVTIPPPAGSAPGTTSKPTGQVFNGTTDFVVTGASGSGPARFIFATEDGTVSGWNPAADPTHAILAVDNSASGAIYKGLAIGANASGNFLYAANFHAGTIDVFDKDFQPVQLAGSFSDPDIHRGFAPFNIQNLGGKLYVTYAKQDADREDDVAGPSNGYVDVFDTDGNLLQRAATRGRLNSPWGLAIAPPSFGAFAGDLLVGNFGDGRINIIDPVSGEFLDQIRDANNRPITIDGLWGLLVGNGGNGGDVNKVYFTAGLNDEANGLFGSLEANP
ncbi:MAG: TIGR03118 family protein [Omnitrophica WOR_2 bacterium]